MCPPASAHAPRCIHERDGSHVGGKCTRWRSVFFASARAAYQADNSESCRPVLNRGSLDDAPRAGCARTECLGTPEGNLPRRSRRGAGFNIVKGNLTPLRMEGRHQDDSGSCEMAVSAQLGRLAKRSATGGSRADAHGWRIRPANAADAELIAGLLPQSEQGRSADEFGLEQGNGFRHLRILCRDGVPAGLCEIAEQPNRQPTEIGFRIIFAVADNLEPGPAAEAADRLVEELTRVIAASMDEPPSGLVPRICEYCWHPREGTQSRPRARWG